MKSKYKKYIKYSVIAVLAIIVLVLFLFVYKTLFGSVSSTRLDGNEKYELTSKETKKVEETFKEIDTLDNIDVYVNYKIIKIFVELKEDVSFDTIKKLSNEAVKKISDENLKYYDVEIFIESKNSDSKVYPVIGYKSKSGSEFVW